MKKVILGLIIVTLFGCTKTAPIVITPPTPIVEVLPKIVYYGKTSYELKIPISFVNIDSIRSQLGVRKIGRWNGNNNLGYAYVDMNNDGREDIFYPIASEERNKFYRPQVFINTKNGYVLDNSMLPDDYLGAVDTRKSIIGDFNNDSLPDIFASNVGFDADPITLDAEPVLLLSNKKTNKYSLAKLPTELITKGGFHGVASGDLNSDGYIDIVLVGQGEPKVLYNNENNRFTYSELNVDSKVAYITCEIIDVDKDGKNDIILAGSENHQFSKIFWGKYNFSKSTTIEINKINNFQLVMDIGVYDLDNDGINEIVFSRTIDGFNNLSDYPWYGGYKLCFYKTNDLYNSFIDVSGQFMTNNTIVNPVIGGWIPHLNIYKDKGIINLYVDIQGCYYYNDYRKNNYTKNWKQNQTTKQFE